MLAAIAKRRPAVSYSILRVRVAGRGCVKERFCTPRRLNGGGITVPDGSDRVLGHYEVRVVFMDGLSARVAKCDRAVATHVARAIDDLQMLHWQRA